MKSMEIMWGFDENNIIGWTNELWNTSGIFIFGSSLIYYTFSRFGNSFGHTLTYIHGAFYLGVNIIHQFPHIEMASIGLKVTSAFT
jgi:hypothetical protein